MGLAINQTGRWVKVLVSVPAEDEPGQLPKFLKGKTAFLRLPFFCPRFSVSSRVWGKGALVPHNVTNHNTLTCLRHQIPPPHLFTEKIAGQSILFILRLGYHCLDVFRASIPSTHRLLYSSPTRSDLICGCLFDRKHISQSILATNKFKNTQAPKL